MLYCLFEDGCQSDKLQPSSLIHIHKNMASLPINIKQDKSTCQELKINSTSNRQLQSQTTLQPEQRVYLYGDTQFSGTLIRPVERTYPPRWSVELDRGGYDCPIINDITPLIQYQIESNTEEIPFCDSPEPTRTELEREIIALKKENARLRQENEQLTEELNKAKNIIRRARDISPIVRQSFKRVIRLAHQACMDVQRTVGGWLLKMGDKARKFRRLVDIWDVLSQDNWYLDEIFPPDKLIPLDQIQPPRPRKKPIPAEKLTLPILRSEEVIRRREMGLPKLTVRDEFCSVID
ncbi:hypothetical protein Sta7437_1975 [Stanieria cyanosphaera PCC 7437]|uniref:Uncharacterized protein n=2 Tax=Stanieria cyanosphaera TaxID=102116 RepID=K9XTY8_STAC7|nr:hypothetical protein Sta7437_1975 [Stanieria cyanosphaera PCC 7437]